MSNVKNKRIFSEVYITGANNCTDWFENIFDVIAMLNNHIYTNGDSVIAFKIDAKPVYSIPDPPEYEYNMQFYYPCTYNNFTQWCANALPVIHISGVKKTV